MGSPYGLPIIENCLICNLRSERFFCDLPRTALVAFEKIKYSSAVPPGAVLFVEGQAPRGMYVLCRGRIKLSTTSRDGKTLILRIAEPGETLQPSQLNFVKREDFLRFLQEHGDACLRAAQHLSQNCQSAYEMIRSLGLSHSVTEKMARLLLEWSEEGETTKDGIRIKIALTHEEIAQLVGTSRETVTRVLRDFRKQQIAQLRGFTLLIRNKTALEKL